MAFQIGQRVLSLKAWAKSSVRFGIVTPVKYQIYTIRAFCSCADVDSLLLEEIVNTKFVRFARTHKRGEPSFGASFFRPLFDLSSLTELSKELENV